MKNGMSAFLLTLHLFSLDGGVGPMMCWNGGVRVVRDFSASDGKRRRDVTSGDGPCGKFPFLSDVKNVFSVTARRKYSKCRIRVDCGGDGAAAMYACSPDSALAR